MQSLYFAGQCFLLGRDHQDLADPDLVGVLDGVLVGLVNGGPLSAGAVELLGDVPQAVALDDLVGVGGTGGLLFGSRLGRSGLLGLHLGGGLGGSGFLRLLLGSGLFGLLDSGCGHDLDAAGGLAVLPGGDIAAQLVHDVVDADVQAALPGQDFCDSHTPPCRTTVLTESRRGRTHRSR